MTFKVKFWGVRGSIACPSPGHLGYGGNTTCLEIVAGDRCVIFDAGTGMRDLGNALIREGVRSAHMLVTHTHWDHINGFPFFAPAYDPDFSLHIMSGHLTGEGGIEWALASQMSTPMFPVPLDAMTANITYHDFDAGAGFSLGDGLEVRTALLNHPNGAIGYRIDYDGRSLCFVTDTEHVPGKPDQNILALIGDADVVIYDSTYTEDEFPAKVGWGHSTWNEGVRLCRAANVKRLVIFHHDPDHNDDFMEKLEAEAKAEWADTIVAREGMTIEIV